MCKKGCKYKTIQSAVDKAKAGDTVKVKSGTYREGVTVLGASKRYLKLIGNPKDPSKVVLDGTQGKKTPRQNGVRVDGANQVTINGFTAKHYNGNGFFVVNVSGYELNHLNATLAGVYGIYAFNSIGGVMENSQASFNNDSGFYIGQTPKQATPVRSIVRNVKSFGNVLGFSGTNMRYVTITKSQWFNNGSGIVPNALDSEKYAPPEDNVITDNDIFWNNFNYYAGAPFKLKKQATSAPYPIGVGVLLFGGRRAEVTNNRIYGNYLVGVGAIKQILLKQADAADLIGNSGPRQRVRAGRSRPQRPRAVLRRQRVGQLLRAQRRRDDDDPGRRLDLRPVSVHRRERVQRGGAERGDQLERRRPDARGVLDQAPARGQARAHAAGALQEVRVFIALALTGVAALAAAPAVAVPPDTVRKPQKKRDRGRRQLLQPAQADREPEVADQLGLDRRVGRRPRRQARSRPPRASRSSRPSPGRPATRTPRRSPSPASTSSSARCTRRTTCG